mmetsp:Transcript_12746/g.29643  ORF Transcript_12746/g.29643 Transcript_12746/m.29643 type:complete len:95 (-) Transcript_12746:1230-1514(-)
MVDWASGWESSRNRHRTRNTQQAPTNFSNHPSVIPLSENTQQVLFTGFTLHRWVIRETLVARLKLVMRPRLDQSRRQATSFYVFNTPSTSQELV